jgi:membrane fusion protein, multidrug efflux system
MSPISDSVVKTSRKPLVFIVLILLALLVGFFLYRQHGATGAGPRPGPGPHGPMGGGGPFGPGQLLNATTPVQTGLSARANVPVYQNALGTVLANTTATVTSKVDGELLAIYFTEGQLVKKGQLLAQIDPRSYQATLKQYQGTLEQNQALLLSAQQTLQRYQQLYSNASLAKQDLDTQIATVAQYAGLVKTDQGQIDAARLNLEYARVTAPISGRVGLRLTDPGNMVHSTDTTGIVAITQTQPIAVTFSIPQANLQDVLPQLRKGKALAVDAFDQQRSKVLATGAVRFISNEIDTTTGSVKLKATFANTDETLYPNQFVNVRMQTGTLDNAVVAPAAALQLSNQGQFMYVVNANNTVSRKAVTTGPVYGDQVVVLTGIDAGSRVVTTGIDHLREGAKVEVISAAAKGTKAAK